MKKALITGITGQDGSYLAEFLLEKGYEVHGFVRRSSSFNRERIEHLHHDAYKKAQNLHLHYGDMTDSISIISVIKEISPDEIYNLAAQSHVGISFQTPEYTANADAIGVLRIIEAVRLLGLAKKTKIYQASTSELFGKVEETPQKETTPFHPRSPYGVAKMYAYWIGKHYREAYNMFISNGILFNHESPRRGLNFVTKKIINNLVKIKLGISDKLYVGNIEAKRDWGYAPEYVESMWLMMQQDEPDDYVIATGETHSVREFIEETCSVLGIKLIWKGEGINERGVDSETGNELIIIDEKQFRPAEVDLLIGDPSFAKKKLGWEPKIKFKELIKLMVEHELKSLKS